MKIILVLATGLSLTLGCAQSGNFTPASKAKVSALENKSIPPAALVSLLPNAGGCPGGYSTPSGSGYLAKLCALNYFTGSMQLIEDVKLVNGSCAVDYMLVSNFGAQSLCVKSAAVGQHTAVVTALYEVTGLCAAGDTMAGVESASLSLCEVH